MKKVKGLNNRDYRINLSKYVVQTGEKLNKSKHHLAARELLKDMFKGFFVYEEVKLPGSRVGSVLYLDFLIDSYNLAVEVHGRQHYEYVPHFHKSRANYMEHKKRDVIKERWCEHNDITLVELKYSDDIDKWREQINEKR